MDEELQGTLKMMQERLSTILDVLTRMEQRQIEVKKEIESEPAQGSFASTNQ